MSRVFLFETGRFRPASSSRKCRFEIVYSRYAGDSLALRAASGVCASSTCSSSSRHGQKQSVTRQVDPATSRFKRFTPSGHSRPRASNSVACKRWSSSSVTLSFHPNLTGARLQSGQTVPQQCHCPAASVDFGSTARTCWKASEPCLIDAR